MKLEYIVAALLLVCGLVSAYRSVTEPVTDEARGARFLIAVHQAAKAMFWLALAGFFLAYGLADGDPAVRGVAFIPIVMAALRLVTASFLARTT